MADDTLRRIDEYTDRLAEVLRDLREDIQQLMTPAEVLDLRGRLSAVADALEAVGADPACPVPAGPVPV